MCLSLFLNTHANLHCIFSVLVNRSPTKDRGLKQGGALAPFLFLLVVKGLSGPIRSTENWRSVICTLGSRWNSFEAFELASGLKVNFLKSSIMRVNVDSDFLSVAERFLHYRVKTNHRKELT
ncbi:RNA-directed DNA polymerase (Reverse transcriptase) [Trifolium medium]|uniref:RNA-directed DNA polymerase (Reverse transcriptase) n=1 Tax=Trifolium medium TaxID=97028 RepID=A0A392MXW2_9FABA|nr:RNA-directed DNA polymerase (Reverse transcriptase) [Trifolium medium]